MENVDVRGFLVRIGLFGFPYNTSGHAKPVMQREAQRTLVSGYARSAPGVFLVVAVQASLVSLSTSLGGTRGFFATSGYESLSTM